MKKITLILLGLAWMATIAHAQSPPTITRNEADVDFPNSVTFELEYDSDIAIVDAVLTYEVEQFGCLDAAASVPVELSGDGAEWQWVMRRSGNPPPGATLRWHWTVTDANGVETITPAQEFTFVDDRFDWQTVQSGDISMNWYKGDDVGPILLEAAVEGLARLENEMGIEMVSDINFYIYGDSAEMRDAVIFIQDWAGGVAFSEYNTILMGVRPAIAESWGRSTVQHEMAHLVIGQYGQSCIGGRRPTWLNEGLAVYAEGAPDADTLNPIADGIANDTFAPLRSLNGAFPAHGDGVGAAYAQSYSVVNYLFETYGTEKMQNLLLTLAAGNGYDEALESVYGFNVDGLEVEWRAAIGASPRTIPPTPTPIVAAAVETAVSQSVPRHMPTPPEAALPPATETKPPPASTGICGLGMVPFLLMGVFAITKPSRSHAERGNEDQDALRRAWKRVESFLTR